MNNGEPESHFQAYSYAEWLKSYDFPRYLALQMRSSTIEEAEAAYICCLRHGGIPTA